MTGERERLSRNSGSVFASLVPSDALLPSIDDSGSFSEVL